ncbi:MAG: hypothetical protein MJ211_09100 [Bacteroidales bacterium]|nr:hypothetical protein [Bacteroidales bacterium]
MAQALLIKSSAGVKENVQGTWHLFDQAAPYIQGIVTSDITENLDAEILASMVSGLPSVWSRAYVFEYAFKYTRKEANIKTGALIKYYESLLEEWKGLTALMAIFPDRISISKPIPLYGGDNIYDIATSFGDMLFEDTDLWCNPQQLKLTKKAEPYIQIIYYNDVAVGATSPNTIFFTSVDNSSFIESADVPWFRNGRLCDPLEFGNLNNDNLQKLYLLVNNFYKKLPDFEKNININREGKEPLILSSLYVFLKNWLSEIKAKGNDLVEEGVLDGELVFSEPFQPLFSVQQNLYYKNGVFSFTENGESLVVDPQKILLQDEYLCSFIQADDYQPLSESVVYYLQALDPNEAGKLWYFAVPLSSYGLNIFKNKIGELVSPSGPDSHELRAVLRSNGKVAIELYLSVDGRRLTPVVKEYKIKLLTGAVRNVIMWPDFVSKSWTAYYLYNEFPSNNGDLKFLPFYKKYSEVGGFDSGAFITDDKGNLVYADNRYENVENNAECIVRYPVEIASADNFPYEIIRSDKPFAGIEIRSRENGKDRVAGYLIIKKYNEECRIKDLSHETAFENVVVGIDFGSNNSCLSYSQHNQPEVKPITFKNRRVFLVGAENLDPRHEKTALRNELLFFQNEIQENGQIKSWVHDHDRKYIPEGMRQEEISGGVPIFEQNLVIHSMDDRTIKTNAGILHHNMKWLSDNEGKEKKKSFLKSVWISALADLYSEYKIATELRWSYPGAFSPYDKLQYQQMYNELANVPIEGHSVNISDKPSTEAEAVCNYSLTNITLDTRNLMLGIDVGGSTSDVLILAMDRNSRAFKLSKQSSLRLAAGMFVSVIKQSAKFRNAVYKYHESPLCKFKVANIKNIIDNPQTSPFYLNSILDRLKDNDFSGFYSTISQSCAEVFAVPAYITGLLLFYSGKLASKTIKENNYSEVSIVDLLPFGKGGRLFDWLDVYPGKSMASDYYNKCFKAGFGEGSENIVLEKRDSIRKDNKSEVSKGLSAPQKVVVSEDIRLTSDLIGESGYAYFPIGSKEPQQLLQDEIAKSEYLSEMDFGISFPTEFPEFEKFLKIFCDFVSPNTTGILKNSAIIENQKSQLIRELKNYITCDAEWQKADARQKQGMPFEYRHSLLVLEGMCFLEKFIIPEIK